jgi:cation diffusion facilitator family transporter
MHARDLSGWQHNHIFAQDRVMAGERRTLVIVLITAVMMVVEIVAGLTYGSMALLADGLHMASHATALAITYIAYIAARRLAGDERFTFGTGKINSLAGFSSAVLLLGFSMLMVSESTGRLIRPVEIAYDQALMVAVIGLGVNALSAWILARTPHHHGVFEPQHHDHGHDHHHHDHNLRAAYLHVLADAMTSLLAIFALVAAKYQGVNWLDPVMGLVGAGLVAKWSFGLLRESGKVLVDRQASSSVVSTLRESIERSSSDRVADLHCWTIGHGILAAEIAIVTENPRPPAYYKSLIPENLRVVHATVEVHRCPHH